MISSVNNEQIKNVIQLQTKASVRKKQKLFVVEGIKMVLETPIELLKAVYVSEDFVSDSAQMARLRDKLNISGQNGNITNTDNGIRNNIIIEVTNNVYKAMSDTVTPQGIMAVVAWKEYSLEEAIESLKNKNANMSNGKHTVLALEDVRDPGNMGTIIRTSEGAGVSLVLMTKECVDIYNSKVIRSTMGSVYRVPFVITDNLGAAIDKLKEKGFLAYAAHLKGELYYNSSDLSENVVIMIGNEANGLSDEISAKANRLIKIPMSGEVESLNAAVATSILIYEARRCKN